VTYTLAAVVGVAVAVAVDLVVLRTRLLATSRWWLAYAIVLFFQLLMNGVLTGLDVVTYDPAAIWGPRIAYAPVEDLAFGFALVLTTSVMWMWLGRRSGEEVA